ncbi:MAG: hypothetical protein QM772_10795 [Ottowia sp.]|uniref:hypothetical protein n=1 Tax=Ottowia sp. TaxID=1898956 RepID=UPI0039E5C9BD
MKPTADPHASRPGALAALAALALASGTSALAQSAPTGITLTCSAPTSTNVVTLDTAADTWGVATGSPPGTPTAAVAYYHGSAWVNAPATWIGADNAGNPTSVTYTLTVNVTDPNIDLTSAQIDYSYRVDNYVAGITWNTTALDYDASTTYSSSTPAAYSGISVPLVSGANTLSFTTTNQADPYGLNAAITLAYNCAPPVASSVSAVPMDSPWALAALAAALGAAGAGLARRRKPAARRG